jgi:DNA processing protein
MEPARLRAILARTPGLMARHLATAAPDGLQPGVLRRLLDGPLAPRARAWLRSPDESLIDSDLRWLAARNCQLISCLDAHFPRALLQLEAAPALLYVSGTASALGRPALGIVGSRQASAAALQVARAFACELARAGTTVVSALEDGIDTAALEGAASGGAAPVAVSTAGLDQVYPARSARLVAKLRELGCLISAFPPGAPPRRYHFPIRNRIIAALGAGTLVVEAAPGGAALITAGYARQLRRRVFAIPGSIRDPAARGCNQLIRDGATLVQHSREILQELQITDGNQTVASGTRLASATGSGSSPLDKKYEMLLDAAGFEPVDIDVLAFRTGWSGHTVASMLLLLELQGRIAPQPGGRYCRLS